MINEESAPKKIKHWSPSTTHTHQTGKTEKNKAWFFLVQRTKRREIQSRHKFALQSLQGSSSNTETVRLSVKMFAPSSLFSLFHHCAIWFSQLCVKRKARLLLPPMRLLIGKGLLHINLTKCKVSWLPHLKKCRVHTNERESERMNQERHFLSSRHFWFCAVHLLFYSLFQTLVALCVCVNVCECV